MASIVSQRKSRDKETNMTAITMSGNEADVDPESTICFREPVNGATPSNRDDDNGDDDSDDDLPSPSPARKPVPVTESTTQSGVKSRSSGRRKSVYADVAYVPDALLRIYSPPRQRQKWGSGQVLPHVNWGNLFFDLFYVAGFYNMGQVLVDDPSLLGVVYFAGCFFPLMALWRDKMMYDSWFVYGDDLFHKIFEIAVLLVLATVVGYIAPVGKMSNPSKYFDVFGFALGLCVAHILTIIRYLESYSNGRGQRRNIQHSSRRNIVQQLIPLTCSIAAAVIAGVAHFGGKADDRRILAAADDPVACSEGTTTTHIPIVLLLVGWLLDQLFHIVSVVFFSPKNGDHKKFTIPINIDFAIHRMGEWTMLLLGESILSLLITDGMGRDHLGGFYAGIMTVVLLQLLHFRSQPHNPDAHAMRRNKNAGIIFSFFFALYSYALLMIGVSYKNLLYGIAAANSEDENKARTLFAVELFRHRLLAPAGDDGCGPTKDERAQMVATLFCISMTMVFVCLYIMILIHTGVSIQRRRVSRKSIINAQTGVATTVPEINAKGILFVLLPNAAITVFIATLAFWQNNPRTLAELGCVAVVCQLGTRLLGDVFFPDHNLYDGNHGRRHHGVEDEDSVLDDSES